MTFLEFAAIELASYKLLFSKNQKRMNKIIYDFMFAYIVYENNYHMPIAN